MLYAAPEVFLGDEYTKESDVWSLGIVIWEIFTRALTGQYVIPYSDQDFDSPWQILKATAQNDVRPTFSDNFPKELRRVVEDCLRKKKEERLKVMEVPTALIT